MGSGEADAKKRNNAHSQAREAVRGQRVYDGPPKVSPLRILDPTDLLAKANDARATQGLPPLEVTVADVVAGRERLDHARAVAAEFRARLEEGRALRDAGMRRAEVNASGWNLLADDAIKRCAELLDTFDADDVWEPDYGNLDTTMENRALGPAFKRAQKAGLIEPTDNFRTSRQPQCHGMPRRVWRSLVRDQ